MNILVTGGAGYIGSHISYKLIELGHNVIIVDNLVSGHRWAVPPKAEFIKCDISDQKLMDQVFTKTKVDVVFHLAAHVEIEESVYQPQKYFNNNTTNSIKFLDSCKKNGIKNIIFSSTGAVYGDTNGIPAEENILLCPINPYGESKRLVENILISNTSQPNPLPKDFNVMILRYFNVAGASLKYPVGPAHPNVTHIMEALCKVATGQSNELKVYGTDYPTPDGTCVRDYIHIDDLVDIHVLALNYFMQKNSCVILNCGSGHGTSVKEIIEVFQETVGFPITVAYENRRKGDPSYLVADTRELQKLLKWRPKHTLKTICESAYDWEKFFSRKK